MYQCCVITPGTAGGYVVECVWYQGLFGEGEPRFAPLFVLTEWNDPVHIDEASSILIVHLWM